MASFLKPKTDKPDIPDCQDESPIFFMYEYFFMCELELQVHLLTFLLEKNKKNKRALKARAEPGSKKILDTPLI